MTLIEVLIVLAIIAITAGVSVLAMGTGSGAGGRAEAARLASSVQLAADRAMIEDSDIALVPARDGYSFLQWNADDGAWRPARVAKLGERHRLPAGMTLTADDARPALPVSADASGRGFTLTLAQKDRHWTIGFDGVTARVKPERAPSPRTGA